MKNKILSLLSFLFIVTLMCSSAHAATITVTERADSFGANLCSLRDAVEFMNTDGMATNTGCSATGVPGVDDTILLEGGAPYVVSLPDNIGGNTDGDIEIADNDDGLIIQGQGMDVTIVTAAYPSGQEDRIFHIINTTDVTIKDLTVTNGQQSLGGGILIEFATVTLEGVHLLGNDAANGGGIANDLSKLTLRQSLITGNTANGGAGIANAEGSVLIIDESTIDDNGAIAGGGVFSDSSSDLVIYNSTISNNRALFNVQANDVSGAGTVGEGGGIFIQSAFTATTIITNSTISTNQATFAGGGIFVCTFCSNGASDTTGQGSGLNFPPGVFLFNDTITANSVLANQSTGGGIWFDPQEVPASLPGAAGIPGEGSVGLFNTILAGNLADNGIGPDCFTAFESGGFNLYGTLAGCIGAITDPTTDRTDPNTGLGSLQFNGGPTQTHGLLANSIAIDTANDVDGCRAPDLNELSNQLPVTFPFPVLDRDQRGFPRPIAVNSTTAICDVGAFEFQAFGFAVTKDDGLDGAEIEVGTNFDYTISVTNNGPGTATNVTLNDPLPAGMAFVAVTPSQGTCSGGATISCDLGDLAAGETATIVVSVTATETGNFTNIVTITLNNPVQQQLTETAQVTTSVTGVFVEGSGIHCELQRDATAAASPRHAAALLLMALVVLGGYSALRRRAHP